MQPAIFSIAHLNCLNKRNSSRDYLHLDRCTPIDFLCTVYVNARSHDRLITCAQTGVLVSRYLLECVAQQFTRIQSKINAGLFRFHIAFVAQLSGSKHLYVLLIDIANRQQTNEHWQRGIRLICNGCCNTVECLVKIAVLSPMAMGKLCS